MKKIKLIFKRIYSNYIARIRNKQLNYPFNIKLKHNELELLKKYWGGGC